MSKISEMLQAQLEKLTDLMEKIALTNYTDQGYGAKRLESISNAISSICRCLSDVKYFEGKDDSR